MASRLRPGNLTVGLPSVVGTVPGVFSVAEPADGVVPESSGERPAVPDPAGGPNVGLGTFAGAALGRGVVIGVRRGTNPTAGLMDCASATVPAVATTPTTMDAAINRNEARRDKAIGRLLAGSFIMANSTRSRTMSPYVLDGYWAGATKLTILSASTFFIRPATSSFVIGFSPNCTWNMPALRPETIEAL
jgi:hypothetical protein